MLKGGSILVPVQTGINFGAVTGFIDFVDGRGGSLQRNFVRNAGFGLFSFEDRNRYEINARMQNIVSGNHMIKWGFEYSRSNYNINLRSSGPAITYAFTPGLGLTPTNGDFKLR